MQSVPDFLEEQFYIQVSDVTSQFHFLAQVPGLPHPQIGSPPPPLVYFYNEDPNPLIKKQLQIECRLGLSEIGAEGQKVQKSKLVTFFYCKIEF